MTISRAGSAVRIFGQYDVADAHTQLAHVSTAGGVRRAALSGVNIFLGIWTLILSVDLQLQHGRTAILNQLHRRYSGAALAIWSGSTTYLDRRHHRHA